MNVEITGEPHRVDLEDLYYSDYYALNGKILSADFAFSFLHFAFNIVA